MRPRISAAGTRSASQPATPQRACMRCLESATQMMESRRKRAAIQGLAKKVKARGEGSARPVVSSRIWSCGLPRALARPSSSAKALCAGVVGGHACSVVGGRARVAWMRACVRACVLAQHHGIGTL